MSAIDCHYVNPDDVDWRTSPGPFQDMSLGNSYTRPGRGSLPAMKRRGVMRRRTPDSDSPSPSHLSRLSGLGINMSLSPNSEEDENLGEIIGSSHHNSRIGEVGNRDRENLRKDILSKHGGKAQSYLLITPPASETCSSRVSIASDARSEASTFQFPSSPHSNNDSELDETNGGDYDRFRQSPDPESPISVLMSYPQAIQLPDSPQSNPRWSKPRSGPDQDSLVPNEISTTPDSIMFQGRLYVARTSALDMSSFGNDDRDTIEYAESLTYTQQIDQLTSPVVSDTSPYVCLGESMPALGQETRAQICPAANEIPSPGLTTPAILDASFSIEDLREEIPPTNLITQSISDNKVLSVEPVDRKASFDMYVNKGNLGSIEDWSDDIPDNFDTEPMDAQSPSTSILMTTAEEELEDRVSRALCNDPTLAAILTSKLKHKLSFILPPFCDEEDRSPFDFSQGNSYSGYDRGAPKTSTSSSAPSTSSKSTSATSAATPATSADMGDQEDDEVPQRSNKRPRLSNPRDPVDHGRGRRRLRCHFHAKSPITHQQKTCILSGWLSIHNLRGHYGSHHTRIRCNKCFQEFDSKPLKNRHQKNCRAEEPAPTLDVIDCDKTDEIEEVFSTFRTWRLDTERDEDMKSWIIKYKVEFASNEVPSDDAHDCRELAKWYHIWQILFPDYQGPVPSPFQNASISPGDLKLERLLEMFQITVESKVENHQLPPSDLGGQIDYYKDVIRTLFRFFLRIPNSNPGASAASSVPSDGRSVSTPASSSSNIRSNRHNAVPSTPTPNPVREDSPSELIVPSDSALRREEDFPRHVSSPNEVAPASTLSTPLSLNSPCAAETRGAVGESPVIQRPQRRISRQHTNTASIYQPALPVQVRTPPMPQTPVFVSSQNGPAMVVQTGADVRSMLPPPSPLKRRRSAMSFATQNASQQLIPHQQHHPQRSQQHTHSPVGSHVPQFITADPTSVFSFPDGQPRQEPPGWHDVEMELFAPPKCGRCFDMGVIFGENRMQQCPCGTQATLPS